VTAIIARLKELLAGFRDVLKQWLSVATFMNTQQPPAENLDVNKQLASLSTAVREYMSRSSSRSYTSSLTKRKNIVSWMTRIVAPENGVSNCTVVCTR
jgi:hypothetical protein